MQLACNHVGVQLRVSNRPYLYSRYWTGTSLQLRLMRGDFSNANDIPQHKPPFQAGSMQSNTENTNMAYYNFLLDTCNWLPT